MNYVEQAAERLRSAVESGAPCSPLSAEFELTSTDAYAIQRSNIRRRVAAGSTIVGRKIGLTSKAIQSWLKVDQPDFGCLLDDMLVANHGSIETSKLLQPRAEAELAFVLKSGLEGGAFTVPRVMKATDFVLPSIEIIDSRIADWKITFEDTVADNASSGMFVLGDTPADPMSLDLRLLGMRLRKNGRVVSTGAGAACLSNPWHAVVWLAQTLDRMGEPLKAGDIVLSGALGPVTPVAPGDVLDASISGVGGCTVRFT